MDDIAEGDSYVYPGKRRGATESWWTRAPREGFTARAEDEVKWSGNAGVSIGQTWPLRRRNKKLPTVNVVK